MNISKILSCNFFKSTLRTAVITCLTLTTFVSSAQTATSSVVIGKENWLFTRYEFATPDDALDTQTTIDLLIKTNKAFEQKGIALALVMVPSKIRIHSEFLPDGKTLDAYTAGKYDAAVSALQAGGVHVVNLNQPFMSSKHRNSDTSLFLHLDTHWSPTGAMLAAETIKAEIEKTAVLKAVLNTIPEEKYALKWSNNKIVTRTRDLVKLLPTGSPTFAAEQTLHFKIDRVSESKAGLLNNSDTTLITVIGSSYTNKNTGYPDALRFTLQRNLLDISIPVDQGPWVGMEAYLRDDAFKTNKPKLIIWEIPERELRSPPNNKYRDARYVIDNNEWLNKVLALLR
jgi:alginate O-acetyltransferase complex protein AlgJ